MVSGQQNPLVAADSIAQQKWVENAYENMSLEERIGQLYMVMVSSHQDKSSTDKIAKLIQDDPG